MRHKLPVLFIAGVLAALTFFQTKEVYSQGNRTIKKVRIDTPDGVELKGHWYPSIKKTAPCVMLIHAIGEDSNSAEWRGLAETLQDNGFNVLRYDLRGHGESTNLANPQRFWALNGKGVKAGANPNVIDYKDFSPSYYTWIINDIASAKALLDIKNDAGECNSSSMVLVGAGTGATLGSVWMNSEWYRYRWKPPAPFQPPGPALDHAYGEDIMAAIWLSTTHILHPKLTPVDLSKVLNVAVKQKSTPTVWLYNKNTPLEAKIAKWCVDKLKNAQNKKAKFIGKMGINSGQNSTGRDLLQSPATKKNIVDYLKLLTDDAVGNAWVVQNFTMTQYCWVYSLAPLRLDLANEPGAKTFKFHNFGKFVP